MVLFQQSYIDLSALLSDFQYQRADRNRK